MNDDEEVDPERRGPYPGLVWLICVAALLFFFYGLVVEPDPEPVMGTRMRLPIMYAIYIGAFGVVLWLVQPWHKADYEEDADGPVCQNCLDPYVEGAHFCPGCAAPLTTFAATAGYEWVYAQAWGLGRAAHGPSRPIQAIGLGLSILPFAAFASMFMLSHLDPFSFSWAALGVGAELGIGCIYVVLLVRCLQNQRPAAWDGSEEETWPAYGHPPYWTYDRWWFFSQLKDELEDELDDHGGGGYAQPPPLPT